MCFCLTGCWYQNELNDMDAETAKNIMQDISNRNLKREALTEKDDTLLQHVVEFYKKEGTTNDLMQAYYLQGSVYRDLHDASKAMEAFLNGINVADTTRDDCRYDLLVRLYGQKTELLYKQKLFDQAAKEVSIISHYARMAHDTLYTVDAQWVRLEMLYTSGDNITVASECMKLLEESKKWGLYSFAAGQLNTSILANLELGRLTEAQKLMTIYEQESGDVDPETMECSFPIYYYTKGRLLTAQGKPDSAEIFFRREMREKDWNNRQAAYRGLREVFEHKGLRDSISKYAILQCEAVDSDYQAKLSENLQDLQQLYDYSRTQEENYQKDLQLQKQQRRVIYMRWFLTFMLLVVCFLFYHLHSRFKQRVVTAELKLERANTGLMEKEAEVERLKEEMTYIEDSQKRIEMARMVEEAEKDAKLQRHEVQRNQKVLDELRRKARLSAKTLRQQYSDTPLFRHLLDNIINDCLAQPEDYEQIKLLLQRKDPLLIERIQALPHVLSEMELKTILLLRIGMTQTEIGSLTAHGKAAIANILNRLYEKANQRKPMNSGESLEWIIGI